MSNALLLKSFIELAAIFACVFAVYYEKELGRAEKKAFKAVKCFFKAVYNVFNAKCSSGTDIVKLETKPADDVTSITVSEVKSEITRIA